MPRLTPKTQTRGPGDKLARIRYKRWMAGGWTRDGAVQDQIDASIEDAVKAARERMQAGASRTDCEDCGAPIPEARQKAVPGVRRCVACQETDDADNKAASLFNRRGNKDSQLR